MLKQIFELLLNHPWTIFRAAVALLIAIVVLQNYEPTSIDFLFWSIANSPKIVIILVSMLLGAAVWELYRPTSFRDLNKQDSSSMTNFPS